MYCFSACFNRAACSLALAAAAAAAAVATEADKAFMASGAAVDGLISGLPHTQINLVTLRWLNLHETFEHLRDAEDDDGISLELEAVANEDGGGTLAAATATLEKGEMEEEEEEAAAAAKAAFFCSLALAIDADIEAASGASVGGPVTPMNADLAAEVADRWL